MMRRAALACSLTAAAVLAAPSAASACSCIAIAPESRFELSDGAVIARLVAVVPRQPYSADYRYRILEVFKARKRLRVGALLVLRAARDSAACGLPRGRGRRDGLFLRRAGDRWQASLCDVVAPSTMREAAAGGGAKPASAGDANPSCGA